MTLINTSIPNLLGGVSQQPPFSRLDGQVDRFDNAYPSLTQFTRKRPSTTQVKLINTSIDPNTTVHWINRDEDEQYAVVVDTTSIRVFDLQGNPINTIDISDNAYLGNTARNKLKFLTIVDYTFVLNPEVVVELGDTYSPSRPFEALIFINQASYAVDYIININGVERGKVSTPNNDDNGNYRLSTTAIASDLATQIQGYFDVCTAFGPVIYCRSSTDFKIDSIDTASNTQMKAIKDNTGDFSNLPSVAYDGFKVEVTPTAEADEYSYWVEFVLNDGVQGPIGEGTWVESTAPNTLLDFDLTTLPWVLVRQANGLFTFEPGDWADKLVGDGESNPEPTFVGSTITNIFFYNNRLGFLSNQNVIVSQAQVYFNFWLTTVRTDAADEYFDITIATPQNAKLFAAIEYADRLLIFSTQAQYTLSHDGAFQLDSIVQDTATSYEVSSLADPISSGKNVYISITRSQFSGVREYYIENQSLVIDAVDVTSHVPSYIDKDINKFTISSNEDVLLCQTSSSKKIIYCYKYIWDGESKLLSSWGKWSFPGDVLGMSFYNSILYAVVQYADHGLFLERMNFSSLPDDETSYETSLDHKFTDQQCVFGAYDIVTNTTKMTVPYISDPSHTGVYEPNFYITGRMTTDNVAQGEDIDIIEQDGTVFTLRGNYESDHPFYIGYKVETWIDLSPFYLKESNGQSQTSITLGRTQIKRVYVNYADTGHFNVRIDSKGRSPKTLTLPRFKLSDASSLLSEPKIVTGESGFGVLSRNTNVQISIHSDSVLPLGIVSLDWIGEFNRYGQKV